MAITVGNEYGTSSLCTDVETTLASVYEHRHTHLHTLGKHSTVPVFKLSCLTVLFSRVWYYFMCVCLCVELYMCVCVCFCGSIFLFYLLLMYCPPIQARI